MTLSAEVARHHTAWIQGAGSRPRIVRYAVDGDQMVCFGDQLPSDATNGRQVSVTVHEIAGGPALAQLSGTVHDVAADDVDANAVLDLLEHVSLGRTAGEVATSIARHRDRRLVVLETQRV
jgi:hypothetical protein